jgi:hypothetical protein
MNAYVYVWQYLCWILLRMGHFSAKISWENQKAYVKINKFFLSKPCIYEIIWKNVVQSDGLVSV